MVLQLQAKPCEHDQKFYSEKTHTHQIIEAAQGGNHSVVTVLCFSPLPAPSLQREAPVECCTEVPLM